MKDQGWGRPFDEPIETPGGKLVTLRDAGEYIAALPKKEHLAPEWQAAMEALLLVVERGGPSLFARIWHHARAEPALCSGFEPEGQRTALGQAQAQEGPMTVFVYFNTARQVGDAEHIKVFATVDAAERWFEENDPEGVAFEYDVLE